MLRRKSSRSKQPPALGEQLAQLVLVHLALQVQEHYPVPTRNGIERRAGLLKGGQLGGAAPEGQDALRGMSERTGVCGRSAVLNDQDMREGPTANAPPHAKPCVLLHCARQVEGHRAYKGDPPSLVHGPANRGPSQDRNQAAAAVPPARSWHPGSRRSSTW
jgi:hypothetical protein